MKSRQKSVFLLWDLGNLGELTAPPFPEPVLRAIDETKAIAVRHSLFLMAKYTDRLFHIEQRAMNHIFAKGYLGMLPSKIAKTA